MTKKQNKAKATRAIIDNYRMKMHKELEDSSFALLPLHALAKNRIPDLNGFWEIPKSELHWAERCFWFKTKNSFVTALKENKTQETKMYEAEEIVLGLKNGSLIFSDRTPVVPPSLSGKMDGIQDKQEPPTFADAQITELAKNYEWRNLEDGSIVTFTVDDQGDVQFISPELFEAVISEGDYLPPLFLGVIAKLIKFAVDEDPCICGMCDLESDEDSWDSFDSNDTSGKLFN